MYKKLSLVQKMAVNIGGALIIALTLLTLAVSSFAKGIVGESIQGELDAVSRANSMKVQQVFTDAESAAIDMQDYIVLQNKLVDEDPSLGVVPTNPIAESLCHSLLYPYSLTAANYDIEQYIRGTASSTVRNNSNVAGMGVYFEPYKFQYNLPDYSIYIDYDNVETHEQYDEVYADYANEAYYKDAKDKKQAIVSEPYVEDGNQFVTYSQPIIIDGEFIGVALTDIDVDTLTRIDVSNEKYPSMYATIYNRTGDIIYDSVPEDIGKNISDFTPKQDELEEILAGMAGSEAFIIETTREDGGRVVRCLNPIQAGSEIWWCQTAVYSTDIDSRVDFMTKWMAILSLVAMVYIIAVLSFLLRYMLRPLKALTDASRKVARGNFDINIVSEYHDEIGELSQIFQYMANNLKRMVQDVNYVLGEMADGNFMAESKDRECYVGELQEFLVSMEKLNEKLGKTLGTVNVTADQVAAGSSQVAAGAQALSQGTTEQAASVEELAATVNEILDHIKDTAANAGVAREQSTQGGQEVIICNRQMSEMIAAMDEISQTSIEIGKIIKTIEDIAFQTNILALNAAVEAARAGAAGKGFAVVADEVRNLASKSAEASQSTAALIEGSIQAVKKGTQLAHDTAESLVRVVESAQATAGTIDKIASAADEQARSIAEVTVGIDQIASVVQTNSATAEESAAASEQLSEQADNLKNLLSQFKIKNNNDTVIDVMPQETPVRHTAITTDSKY